MACKGLAQIRRKAVYPKQTKNPPPNPTPGKNKRTSTLVEAGKENKKREKKNWVYCVVCVYEI
jgi:hypothetical protein